MLLLGFWNLLIVFCLNGLALSMDFGPIPGGKPTIPADDNGNKQREQTPYIPEVNLFSPDLDFDEGKEDFRMVVSLGSRFPRSVINYDYCIDSRQKIVYSWSTLNTAQQVNYIKDQATGKIIRESEGRHYNVIRYCEMVHGYCVRVGKIYTQFEVIEDVYPINAPDTDDAYILVKGFISESEKKKAFSARGARFYGKSLDLIFVPFLGDPKEQRSYAQNDENDEEEPELPSIYYSDIEDFRKDNFLDNDYNFNTDFTKDDQDFYFEHNAAYANAHTFYDEGAEWRNSRFPIIEKGYGDKTPSPSLEPEAGKQASEEEDEKVIRTHITVNTTSGAATYRAGSSTYENAVDYMTADQRESSSKGPEIQSVDQDDDMEDVDEDEIYTFNFFNPLTSDFSSSGESMSEREEDADTSEMDNSKGKGRDDAPLKSTRSRRVPAGETATTGKDVASKAPLTLDLTKLRAASVKRALSKASSRHPNTDDDIPGLETYMGRLHIKYMPDMVIIDGPFLWLLELCDKRCFLHRHFLPILTVEQLELYGITDDDRKGAIFRIPYFENHCLIRKDQLFFSFDVRFGSLFVYALRLKPSKKFDIECLFVLTNLPFRKFADSNVEVVLVDEPSRNYIFGPDKWVFLVKEDFSAHLLVLSKSIVPIHMSPSMELESIDFSHPYRYRKNIQWITLLKNSDLKTNMFISQLGSRLSMPSIKAIMTRSGHLRIPLFVEPIHLLDDAYKRQSLMVVEISNNLQQDGEGKMEQTVTPRYFAIDSVKTQIYKAKMLFMDQKVFFMTEEESPLSKNYNPCIVIKSRQVIEKVGKAGRAFADSMGVTPTPGIFNAPRKRKRSRLSRLLRRLYGILRGNNG